MRNKLFAILLGGFAAMFLAEVGLRVAGYVAYSTSGRGVFSDSKPGLRILCHGDSNVFGVFEPAEESYPNQLNSMLDERTTNGPHTVVNLGIPGFGVRQLLSVIEKDLERYDPDVVLVTVGVNDAWRWKPNAGAEYVEAPFWESFRLVKAVRLYFYSKDKVQQRNNDHFLLEASEAEGQAWQTENREGEQVKRFAGSISEVATDKVNYQNNLRHDMIRLHEILGEKLIISCYASNLEHYGDANAILRKVAIERQIPLVDVSHELEELVSKTSYGEVFWSDLHPRGVGYEVVARGCFDKLVELNLIQAEPYGNRIENLRAHQRDAAPNLVLRGTLSDLENLAVSIKDGDPGRLFRLVFWDGHRSETPPPERNYYELAKADRLFQKCLKDDTLLGQFDDAGQATILLRSFVSQGKDLDGLRMRAGYIVFAEKTGGILSRFSDSVIIEMQ